MEDLPNGPTSGLRPETPTDTRQDNNNPILSVENLLEMSPLINDIDLVGRACRHLFMSHLKNQPSVHDLFFPDQTRDLNEDRIDPSWFDFDEFAALFACQAIKNTKDPYKIYTLIDDAKVEEMLADCYAGPLWKKIGNSWTKTKCHHDVNFATGYRRLSLLAAYKSTSSGNWS